MAEDNFKVTIHMVSSLDGFIAKEDGSVSWMESKDQYPDGVSLTAEEIDDFLKSIDCYVIGSGTYLHALKLGWPYGDTPVYVLTNQQLDSNRETVHFYSGGLETLVEEILKPMYRNVWMGGGAELTKSFLNAHLADEIIVTILPIILGEGKLFFEYIGKEIGLHLKYTKAYKDGMVELCYQVVK